MEPEKIRYYKAPPGWDEESENPFASDGSYGPGWSCLRVVATKWEPYGKNKRGLYRITKNPDNPDLKTHLADFLRYENSYGRSVILSFPDEYDIDDVVEEALRLTPLCNELRPTDHRHMLHSTTLEAWERIQADGELRSSALLRRKGREVTGVGFRVYGEPEDYAEYVMLGVPESIGCEHVVASWHKGEVITEEDTPYAPGVRLYIDGHEVIRDGLLVRDGLHSYKVRNRLPLEPYLIAAITAGDVDPKGEVEEWTPRTFLEAANRYFVEKLGGFGEGIEGADASS